MDNFVLTIHLLTVWSLIPPSVRASHSVLDEYSGSGLIPLETADELVDIDGNNIQCTLSGSTYVDIEWKWNDSRVLDPGHYFQWSTTKITIGGSSLSTGALSFRGELSEATKRGASGIIFAQGAHNADPSEITKCKDVSLTIAWKPEGTPSLSVNKNPFVIGEDSKALLTCQLTDKGNPKGKVRWVKNGILQSESEFNTQTITKPVTRDINGDNWHCYYYNTAGNGNYSKEVMINVHWKPLKPSLSITKNTFVIGEDSTAQLSCQLTDTGNPEGLVRWIKHGNLQSESEYNTQTISIPVTKDINGNQWRCFYYNDAGDGDDSDVIMINVHWKPEQPTLSINEDPLVVGEDSAAHFTCQITYKGNPEGQVRWIKNGNRQSESKYNTHTISIPMTKDINSDHWRCFYYNEAGDGDYSNEVVITVHWSPGGATISADTQTPKREDTLTFMCTGDIGNPPGQVLWYLDERLVANTTSKQHTVTDVEESHNGNWDCMFSNYLNDGARSQRIQIKILCLSGVLIDYITYEFTFGYVNFTLKTKNAFAASTLEVSVCTVDDSPSCEVAKSNIKQNSNLKQSVGLPESSDGAVYNVTFTFSNNYRNIVTQHGIALKGTVVQSQVPVILAALFGTLLVLAIVTIITLVYVFHWRNKATGTNVQSENSVHYVNVGSEGNSGGITHIQATTEYEDVNAAATNNGQSSNIGNATYMDLDTNGIQQTRNIPADITVYQSLN